MTITGLGWKLIFVQANPQSCPKLERTMYQTAPCICYIIIIIIIIIII